MAAIPIPDKVHLLDNRLKPKTFENRTVLELLKTGLSGCQIFLLKKLRLRLVLFVLFFKASMLNEELMAIKLVVITEL